MGSLTPLDIETVEFKKTPFKGYSSEEVDLFLDKVIMEFEKLYSENAKMKDALASKDEIINHYKGLEDTIKSSIVRAEKTADDTVKNATSNAEHIVNVAEERAKNIILDAQNKIMEMMSEANNELADVHTEISKARSEYIRVKNLLRNMLETHINILDENKEDFEQTEQEK